MHTISFGAGAARAVSLASRFALRTSLGVAMGWAISLASPTHAAERPQAALGEPVNRYAPNANVYELFYDGEVHPWHLAGQVWLMAGQPGEANVAVQIGDEGVLVVDTGAKALAPKLLERIQQMARGRPGTTEPDKSIRIIINTGGDADHIGGNAIVRASGGRIIAGEEAGTANAFGEPGAAIWAHQKVLDRLVAETAAGGANAPTEQQWPSDAENEAVYGMQFNGEAVQLHHAPNSTTDGQVMVLFRGADVVLAGDVLNMTSYPTIDVAHGGTIDGVLVALNKLIDLAVPDDQVSGGTIVVPGHGRLSDVADVARYAVMVTTIRNRVQYYKNQGRTLQQVLALNPSAEYDERWSAKSGLGSTREFLTAVYNTLPRRGPVFFTMENNALVNGSGSGRQR